MRSIGEIIADNRRKNKMSQPDLAASLSRCGHELTNKAISKWETDKTEPSLTVFFDLCRILGITNIYEEFIGENPTDPLSFLNEEGKEKVYEYAELLISSGKYKKPHPAPDNVIPFVRRLPLQLYPVSAGPGNFLLDENYENIPVDDDVPMSADFGVRVSGDSMEPLLHNNQIIWVHKQTDLEHGEIGIFFLDGEAYVKKFQHNEHGTFLISLNSAYAPLPVTSGSDFRIFGKVVH